MLNNSSKSPLYEQLYNHIKEDILSKKILAGEKLPSKRQLAAHLKISVMTVETAYEQLISEGYIFSRPKSGYYVNDIQKDVSAKESTQNIIPVSQNLTRSDYKYEFKTNAVDTQNFPFSIWAKLIREVLRDKDKELLNKSEAKGVYALRVEIARYLKAYRGISCHPEQIVVGAGSEYLINLIIQLLDKAKRYAVENPGYHKIARIISSYGIDTEYLPLDEFGVNIDRLIYSKADVLHISPSHQFPTGITTPVKRRYELLQWAANSNGYIIEDDYDSEFRYTGKPVPALQSLDVNNRVIYMNTFTKSLAPSLRISYMVLPPDLMYKFDKEFTFYSNTVSCFEQYTLARFMSDGYFERHLNRMRNIYKNRISAIKEGLAGKNISIKGENIGLHLVLEFDKSVNTAEIVKKAAEKSVHITDINSYYVNGKAEKPAVVLGYTGMDSNNIREAIELLNEIW
jgi:GntR family transcriptional regulator/MocR family aminotransferase